MKIFGFGKKKDKKPKKSKKSNKYKLREVWQGKSIPLDDIITTSTFIGGGEHSPEPSVGDLQAISNLDFDFGLAESFAPIEANSLEMLNPQTALSNNETINSLLAEPTSQSSAFSTNSYTENIASHTSNTCSATPVVNGESSSGKGVPGDTTFPGTKPPTVAQTNIDTGGNNLENPTTIVRSTIEDVIDQVSNIDPTDIYRANIKDLQNADISVLSGKISVNYLMPSGQLLGSQVLSKGTHILQPPADIKGDVIIKIDNKGNTPGTYIFNGFESKVDEPFNIDLEFEGGISASQQATIQAAAKSVEAVIRQGLPTAIVDGKLIDDVNFKISATNLDGAGGTAARTKIDFMRFGTMLPAQSITQFDVADIADLERSGELFSVVQHELLHGLGFGNLWEAKGLVDYAGTPLAQYNGKEAVEAFQEMGGLTDNIALENQGQGSAGLHWNENIMQDEVMTADYNNGKGGNAPVSTVTIASLADLGYEVNLDKATPDFGLFGAPKFKPEDLTQEQVEAFQELAETSFGNPSDEFIYATMPSVDPDTVAPEIWAHAERFHGNGEYYEWKDYVVTIPGDGLSNVAKRTMGNGSEIYWKWIANHNGIFKAPYWIYLGDNIKIPVLRPNYEWEQEQERLRREAELRQRQEEEARIRREQEEAFAREQERVRQEAEARQREAEAKRQQLEEQERRLRQELERRRQEEERIKEEARIRELERQAEIARQQGKGGLDWFVAKPLPEFGSVDPFETRLTGETVGNLVPNDYYRFTLSRNGRITAELKQLLADADLVLYDVRNRPISYSMRDGITDEQLIADLIPGTYMLRVNSPKGVTTDYELIVKYQHLLSRTQRQPIPPGWRRGGVAAGSGTNSGGRGRIPSGATFADPRIEKIFKEAVSNFAVPERRRASSKVNILKSERNRLENEKKTLIDAKSAELRGKVHEMLDGVKSNQQGSVNGTANNINGGIDWVANGAIGAINGMVPDWVFNLPFGTGGWFRDRFNEAKDAIEGAINGARNWLKAKVDEVRNTINDAISWFIEQTKNLYFTAGEANIAIEGIANQFREKIENATAALNGLIGTFKGMVLGQIEWTRHIGVPGWNLYDNGIVGLINNLTNGVQDKVRDTGRFFMDRVEDAEKGVQWVIGEIGNLLGDETGRIYNEYQEKIRSLNGQIEGITNETDRRIRDKEIAYKNQIQNFLNQLGNEGEKILDTILNFANSPAGQIGMAVLEVILGMIPGVGQALDIKDTAIALNNIFVQGKRDVWEFVGLIGALAGWVPGVGDAIKSVAKIAKNGVDALATFLGKLGPDVTKAVIKAIDSTNWGNILRNLISDIGKKWDNFNRSAENAADWIIDALGLKPAWANANNAMFSFRNGADDVAQELTPTQRHFREAVEEAARKAVNKAAKATINSSVATKLLDDTDKLELKKAIKTAKNKNDFLKTDKGKFIAEGNGFANFVKTKLPSEYHPEFKHNPDSLNRSADAFAFIEKEGKEGASLIEIMRSGKPFETKVSPKFSQAESYGNAIGHFLVLGQPVKMKYIFHEAPTAIQQANLMEAVKTGLEEAIERRFDYLVKEGVDPSTLTKEVSLDIQIEVWK